jgi:uncharacterized protein DUF4304
MKAQEALRVALRDQLGPIARAHGYKGSAPTWRKNSPAGDWAVVSVGTSRYSTANRLHCSVSMGFAPEPWLRWEAEHLGTQLPERVSESVCLYWHQLGPEGRLADEEQSWDVYDQESALLAVSDMVVQLDRVGWPVLERMFDRTAMVERVRSRELGSIRNSATIAFLARAEALLLMDAGPSDTLESLLAHSMNTSPAGGRAHAERFNSWVRAQAERVGE